MWTSTCYWSWLNCTEKLTSGENQRQSPRCVRGERPALCTVAVLSQQYQGSCITSLCVYIWYYHRNIVRCIDVMNTAGKVKRNIQHGTLSLTVLQMIQIKTLLMSDFVKLMSEIKKSSLQSWQYCMQLAVECRVQYSSTVKSNYQLICITMHTTILTNHVICKHNNCYMGMALCLMHFNFWTLKLYNFCWTLEFHQTSYKLHCHP